MRKRPTSAGLRLFFGEEVFDGAGNFSRGLDDDVEALHLDGAAVRELEGFGVVAVGGEGDVGDAQEAFVSGETMQAPAPSPKRMAVSGSASEMRRDMISEATMRMLP